MWSEVIVLKRKTVQHSRLHNTDTRLEFIVYQGFGTGKFYLKSWNSVTLKAQRICVREIECFPSKNWSKVANHAQMP